MFLRDHHHPGCRGQKELWWGKDGSQLGDYCSRSGERWWWLDPGYEEGERSNRNRNPGETIPFVLMF